MLYLAYVPRQQPKVERVLRLGGHHRCRRGHVHIKAHQLLIFSFALIQTDNNVAGKLLDRIAVRGEAGPVSRTRRKDANAVGVRERSGFEEVEGHALDLCKRIEARPENMVREMLETAERASGGRGGGGA